MAHVQKRQRTKRDGTPGTVVWCLRYIDPETGKERTQTFRLKRDAERRLTEVEASKLTGSYVDPRAGKVDVHTWAERWLDGQVQLKPTTRPVSQHPRRPRRPTLGRGRAGASAAC